MQLVDASDKNDELILIDHRPKSAPEPKPAADVSKDRDSHWVVKPKPRRSVETKVERIAPVAKPKEGRKRPKTPHYVGRRIAPSLSAGREQQGSRRWLAIGLTAMIYGIGVAGLWSMVQTFTETTNPSLTPAAGEPSLPPIEETIQVRDARLDGPFIPKMKPDALSPKEEDVASADLQERS